jgi:hypothetical protein
MSCIAPRRWNADQTPNANLLSEGTTGWETGLATLHTWSID